MLFSQAQWSLKPHSALLLGLRGEVLLEKLQRLSVRLTTVGAQEPVCPHLKTDADAGHSDAGRQAGKGSGWQDLESGEASRP